MRGPVWRRSTVGRQKMRHRIGVDERADNPLLWGGENLPGFALMEARDRLGGND